MCLKSYFVHIVYALLACVSFSSLEGFIVGDGYLDLTNGYRQDKISSLINISDRPDNISISDHFTAEDIKLYQVGLKGRWDFCDFLVRLEGNYGQGNQGHYHEELSTDEGHVKQIHAHIRKARMADFVGGAGYSFSLPFSPFFSIGPIVGWSYERQQFKLNEARINDKPSHFFNHAKYINRWQGPWVGVDVAFNLYRFAMHGGYEYHWANLHANWEIKGIKNHHKNFSDHRRCDNAHGQVAYLNCRYSFSSYCTLWNIGLGLKWQEWKAPNGHLKPSEKEFAKLGLDKRAEGKLKHATWCSFAATFDIGYTF